MMIKSFLIISALLLACGCQSPNEDCCDIPREVIVGEPFSITEGQKLEVENSSLSITFSELISDSLCPEDVECVTQGTLKITIGINGTVKDLSIGDISNSSFKYKNYTIELQDLIYPTKQYEKDNINSTYAVQMLISES